jgi:uncharacterized protein YndB with AHSA1/START domain
MSRQDTTELEPVVNSVTVQAPIERAFEIFTSQVRAWWPLDRYSVAADEDQQGIVAVDAVLEPRAGGRFYEVRSDGSEAEWGEVVECDAPRRIVVAWHPGAPASASTEWEARFTPEGEGTRVELEHRGWERLGERAAEAREGYANGWPRVLAGYASSAEEVG